jgi:hypothetical protein
VAKPTREGAAVSPEGLFAALELKFKKNELMGLWEADWPGDPEWNVNCTNHIRAGPPQTQARPGLASKESGEGLMSDGRQADWKEQAALAAGGDAALQGRSARG